MLQLKEKNKDNSIPVSELKDGQIGVITEWSNDNDYLKIIIQRSGDYLIVIGSPEDWIKITTNTYCRARVLPEGTELIITNNQ